MRRTLRALALACGALLAPFPAAAQEVGWGDFTAPAAGAAASIGKYNNGCLVGGVGLPTEGPGFQVIRTSRHRFYGHPTLVQYLLDLGERAALNGLGPILVGDMSQPRGGPMRSGHASHQTGLDADIWLRLDLPPLPVAARENLDATNMVSNWRVDPGVWGDRQAALIWLAANDARTARIFVNPAIKLALCEMDWPDRSWLRVVRPWVGHDSHFHVRLHCPAGDPYCEAQEPPPEGDGCGEELMSWFPDPDREPVPAGPAEPPPPPPLPLLCQALLDAPAG